MYVYNICDIYTHRNLPKMPDYPILGAEIARVRKRF